MDEEWMFTSNHIEKEEIQLISVTDDKQFLIYDGILYRRYEESLHVDMTVCK